MWRVAAPWLQKERRLLENRRLDLDICKARLKKAKQAEAKAAVRAPHTRCSGHLATNDSQAEKNLPSIILVVNNCIVNNSQPRTQAERQHVFS